MARRRTTVSALLMVVALGVSACGGDENPGSDPSGSPSQSATTLSPTMPTSELTLGPPPGWEEDFTAEQLSAYEAAVRRYHRYLELSEPIYREGKDTAQAREVIREYNLQWKRATSQFIRYYVEGGLRTVVSPVPAWTRATSVNLNSDGSGTVIFEQCNDYRNVVVTRSGKPVKSAIPKHDVTPLVVHMSKSAGDDWKIAEVELEDLKSCDG